MPTTINYFEALKAANEAPFTPARVTGGCGRAYVMISKEHRRGISAASKKLGLRYLTEAYGVGKGALYIGYDNADGRALAKSEVMAKVLNSYGISCYEDGASD
jgi:hypothetical protein